jgi:hypothetical protein
LSIAAAVSSWLQLRMAAFQHKPTKRTAALQGTLTSACAGSRELLKQVNCAAMPCHSCHSFAASTAAAAAGFQRVQELLPSCFAGMLDIQRLLVQASSLRRSQLAAVHAALLALTASALAASALQASRRSLDSQLIGFRTAGFTQASIAALAAAGFTQEP